MALALFFSYVVLAYLQPGELVPALAPYRLAFWTGLAGLGVALVSQLARRGGQAANLQLWLLLAFTAVAALSLMIAERWPGAPIAVLQRFGPSLTIFALALCSVTSLARLRLAAGCVVLVTMMLMLQGVAAYHLGYNAPLFVMDRSGAPVEAGEDFDPANPAWDPWAGDAVWQAPRIRALGFMNDPNDLALAIVAALGLIGGAWRPSPRRRVLLLAAAGALVYGVYLTRSRGGAVALLVVLWRFAAPRIGRVPAFVLVAALGAGALALDFGGRSLSIDMDASASGRLLAWREGLDMLEAEPLLGVGYGGFLDRHTLTAHNSLVLCFAETGLLGTFFWVGLLVVTLLELRGVRNLPGCEPFDESARRWAEGLQLSLIGFMAAAFFLSRTFAPTLYLIAGLSAALAAIVRDAGRPVPLPAPPALGMLVLVCEVLGIGVVYALVKLHVA